MMAAGERMAACNVVNDPKLWTRLKVASGGVVAPPGMSSNLPIDFYAA